MDRRTILKDRLWMEPGDWDYSGLGMGHFCMPDKTIEWGSASEFYISRWFDRLRDSDMDIIEDRIKRILSGS